MCIAYILICISIIVLVYILLNEYKIKNINDKMNNQTETFYTGGGGSRPGGGYGRTGGRLGHGGGGSYSNGRGNYYGGHGGHGGRGSRISGGHRNFWRRPYLNGWNDWYPFYSYDYDYYPNYTGDWRLCPEGRWCPPYLSCDDPYCI